MKILAIDVETTTYNKGHHADTRNKLVCISAYDGRDSHIWFDNFEDVGRFIHNYDSLVGHNIKFDLHWLANTGIDFSDLRIIDTSIVEFILSRQKEKWPSLNDIALRRLGKTKLDHIQLNYWDHGIQTDEIPRDELALYAIQDVILTYDVYQDQLKQIKPSQQALISLCCQDLLVLQEMEKNGLRYNRQKSLAMAEEKEKEIADIQQKLSLYHDIRCFNWASNDHLSALLYGGTIEESEYVPAGIYKTGPRAGQVKLKKQTKVYNLPRIYEPLKGSELKKKGFYSVDEDTLSKLKGKNKGLLEGILTMKKLQKDISTYLCGIPKKQTDGHYNEDYIYGNFSQVNVITGRLASQSPNLQNLSPSAQMCFESRYA